MHRLRDDLNAFLQEHHRCGELDSGVDGERVWMTCRGSCAKLESAAPRPGSAREETGRA